MASKFFLGRYGRTEAGDTSCPWLNLTAQDLKDFLSWLRKDIAYKTKRSNKHQQENPGSGDANAGAIAGRKKLAEGITDLLIHSGDYES